jgi:hypothetical protein
MTKTHETIRNRARRYLFGFGSAALLLGAGVLLTLPTTTQEPLVTAPVSQWLGLTVTQTARDAYVHAMLQDGWELQAPVRIDDV